MLADIFNKNQESWPYIAAGSILVLAAILRLWNIGSESAWIDEAYSITLAGHSMLDILKGTAADQHPPLYYLLLKVWMLFGSGITYARFLSVIIGVINVGQILHFGNRTAGITIGLLAGLLVAISPMHVWYSQEIRMYILLVTLTTASTAALWWALKGNRPLRWISYIIFSILALYTHYFAVFILLAHGIFMSIWVIKRDGFRDLWFWIGSMAATGLLFLPWLPVAINQARFHTMTWVDSPTISIIRDTLLRLIFGIAMMSLPDILRWGVFIVVVAVLFWSIVANLRKSHPNINSFFYVLIWGFIPFIIISIIAMIYPVYQFKQYLLVLPPILLLTAWITQDLPRKLGIISILILVLAASVSLAYQQVILTKDDWRGSANFIESNVLPGDVIFGNPAASSLAISLYTDVPLIFAGIPDNYDIITGGWDGEMLTRVSANQFLRELNQDYQRLWLVEFFPEFWDENRTIENWLGQNAQIQDDQYFGRIHVRIYALVD
jgi:uncharacterized membrane protein